MTPTPDVTPAADSGGRQRVLQALGDAHRFTRDELEANRAGKIHARQIEAGVRRGRIDVRFGSILLGVGVVLLLAGTALAFFPRALKDADFTLSVPKKASTVVATSLMGTLLAVLPFVLGGLARGHGRKVVAAYAAGRAERVEGPLKKLHVRRQRTGDYHYYNIGGKLLRLAGRGFEASTAGAAYRAYYVPHLDELLSIEPL